MKNLSLVFMLSVLFASCYNYYSPSFKNYKDGLQESQFTSIPIKPTVEKVKIFFPGEKIPDEPYIKVDVIDAFGDATISSQDMFDKLQNQAKIKGMDAIIVISRDNISEIARDDFYEDYTVTTQKLSAVGIKFIKNITYLDECIKGGTILKWDETKNEFIEVSKFKSDWKGNLVELESGDKFYYNFLHSFSLQHLAYEHNSNWLFTETVYSPAEKTIKRAKTNLANRLPYVKEVKLKEVYGRIVSADVKSVYNQIYSGKVKFKYDKTDRLIIKTIKSKKLGEYRQEFIYNENGVLSKIEVFKTKGDEAKAYFKVVYENYQQSDLAQLLEDDQN